MTGFWVLIPLKPQGIHHQSHNSLSYKLSSEVTASTLSSFTQSNFCHQKVTSISLCSPHTLVLPLRCSAQPPSLSLTPAWSRPSGCGWPICDCSPRQPASGSQFTVGGHLSSGSLPTLPCFQGGPYWPVSPLANLPSDLHRRHSPLRQQTMPVKWQFPSILTIALDSQLLICWETTEWAPYTHTFLGTNPGTC